MYINHIAGEKEYHFDTEEVKEILGGMPINKPDVLKFIEEMIRENLTEIGALWTNPDVNGKSDVNHLDKTSNSD
ncbi:MAG: hypothetical protein HC906_17120 [Bacteroidales bacterium]|nr:hypothetical protein [Bacteroidales bacterium]